MLFPVWRDLLLLPALHYEQCYHSYHGRLARRRKWRACDVGEAEEGLEDELWRTWSRAHSPTFPSLHLRHSSFSNPSIAFPTSQLILQPFHCFTYATALSPTLLSLLLRHRLFSYVTWRAAQGKNGNTVPSEAREVIVNPSIQEITCRRAHVFWTGDITLILSISLAPVDDAIVSKFLWRLFSWLEYSIRYGNKLTKRRVQSNNSYSQCKIHSPNHFTFIRTFVPSWSTFFSQLI